MKKLIYTLLILATLATMKANALCYWSTQVADGWDGYGVYSGKACFTNDGMQQISFTPIVPLVNIGFF